jgi:hypothetical protein
MKYSNHQANELESVKCRIDAGFLFCKCYIDKLCRYFRLTAICNNLKSLNVGFLLIMLNHVYVICIFIMAWNDKYQDVIVCYRLV